FLHVSHHSQYQILGKLASKRRKRLDLGKSADLGGNPHTIAADAANVAASGVPPGNGEGSQSRRGRVISVSWGEYTRQIGIDGTSAAIKEAIRVAFRLRTKRMFWLEDEEHTIRTIDRGMPIGNYTLHIDEGLAIQICQFDEFEDLPIITEDKIFYTQDDFHDFLVGRSWICLQEYDSNRNIDNMDDLRPGVLYRGVRRG
ncbi:unnamed protein product, partial [Trifolium pratense]